MLAETAELAVVLKLKDQLTGPLSAAQGKLAGLEASASAASAGGMTRLQKAATGVGTALGHAKSQLSGLVGGFGLLAGGAAAFGVFGALEQGVKRVEDMGLAVEKLTGVTGLSVHSASQLVAVFEKFGVDAGAATTSAAFAEKTIGKLAATMTGTGAAAVSKLTELDKQYGISLVDAKGNAVDYATELGIVADYYTSNASASSKAALAAQLFGRGYVSLIPILKLGSAGIAEAAAEADKLGVTLKSAEDVANVKAFIAAQRDAQEAIGGLEMQLGLLVLPDLAKGLTGFRDFIVNNRAAITGGFHDLLGLAEQIGGAFTNVVLPAIQMIGGVWNSLPGPIRELLIGGFLANKAIKWTFGIDVAGLAGGALKGAIEGLFKNATTAQMNVAAGVVNVGGAGGAVATAENALVPAAETAGGVGLAATVAGVTAALGAGAVVVAAGYLLSKLVNPKGEMAPGQPGYGPLKPGDVYRNPFNTMFLPPGTAAGEIPTAVTPGSKITTPTNIVGDAAAADRRAALAAQDFGTALIMARNELSGGLSAQLKGGRVGETAAGLATSITGIFAKSTAPSLTSMSSAMKQLRDLQARYIAQGDTKLAAAIGSDIRYLSGRVDAVAAAIKAKEFTVQQITTANTIYRQGERGDTVTGDPKTTPNVNAVGFNVNVQVSNRQNTHASVISDRYGPTAAGGQAVYSRGGP